MCICKIYMWDFRYNLWIAYYVKVDGDGDEVHFVLCCPAFDDLRTQSIPLKYFRHPNLFRLGLLLATQKKISWETFVCICIKHLKGEVS